MLRVNIVKQAEFLLFMHQEYNLFKTLQHVLHYTQPTTILLISITALPKLVAWKPEVA